MNHAVASPPPRRARCGRPHAQDLSRQADHSSSCRSPPAAPPTSSRARSGSGVTERDEAAGRGGEQARRERLHRRAAGRPKAAPDGYTVLITTNTTHAANEHLFKKLPYDPVKDFAPVTALGKRRPGHGREPEGPGEDRRQEFVALAKKKPGKLTFGSGSSSSRVAGELLQQMAGIQLLHVPYKSNPLAITDLLGGQIDMMITDTATGLPQVKAGKLRALGVTAEALAARARHADDRRGRREGLRDEVTGSRPTCPRRRRPPVVKRLHELLVARDEEPVGAASSTRPPASMRSPPRPTSWRSSRPPSRRSGAASSRPRRSSPSERERRA